MNYLTGTTKELIHDILRNLPEEKLRLLDKACYRNYLLTSVYGQSSLEFKAYNEGFLLKMSGTRSSFSVWVFDRDGVLEYGRKPAEKGLHLIWSGWCRPEDADIDFNNIVN